MPRRRIYFDYAASTPLLKEAEEAMRPYARLRFGNPASLHSFGQEAIAAVDRARESVAHDLGADFREVVFTGSATEANNLALRGVVIKARREAGIKRPALVISAIEHESVLATAEDLARDGVRVTLVPPSHEGSVDLRALSRALTPETVLVSVMHVNNEVGTVQPIQEISKLISEFRKQKIESRSKKDSRFYFLDSRFYPLFHTDAAQAFAYLDCVPRDLGADLMTVSGHKLCGPKGVGALYVRNYESRSMNSKFLLPILTGGGQEFGVRSGTENVPLIVGFAHALREAVRLRSSERKRLHALSRRFIRGLQEAVPGALRNGRGDFSPHIVNVRLPGVPAEEFLVKCDLAGIALSAGSACAARSIMPSYVLRAFGAPAAHVKESVRFSFGRFTTKGEIDRGLRVIRKLVRHG